MPNKRLLTVVLLLLVAFSLTGITYILLQSDKPPKSFEIVFTKNNSVIISDQDIVRYNGTSNEISLNQNGLASIRELKVPLEGFPFELKIDGERICNGTFMTPISSYSAPPCDVVIETLVQNDIIKLQNGYPPNPTANISQQIRTALEKHFQSINKLVT